MAIIRNGQIYLAQDHIEELENAPHYVRDRYLAMVQLHQRMATFTIQEAADKLGRSVRQVYRYLKRFREEGIHGLFNKSRRPKTSPNQTPSELEAKVLEVRKATGLGQEHIARLVGGITGRTVHRVLARHDEVDNEPREKTEWQRFEWPRPNALIQADLTYYNGVPLLTCQDDHSRHAWTTVLPDEDATTIHWALKHQLPTLIDNILTDNGPQFAKHQPLMRKYCQAHVKRKHITARAYHPETLGKIGAFQKALKRFLRHVVGDRLDKLAHWVKIFTDWYNAGRHHRAINTVPDDRYHGKIARNADRRFLEAFNISTPAHPSAGD